MILLLSDSLDITTDYVAVELNKRREKYIRLNRDHFSEYKIFFDINKLILKVTIDGKRFVINNSNLRSVFYRAPTFLRETFSSDLNLEQQLYRSQWMAFTRNMAVFGEALWVNNPVATYKAENKFLQLNLAKQFGFNIPMSFVINETKGLANLGSNVVVKSIDTVIVRKGKMEGFFYTHKINKNELKGYDLASSPIFLQEYIQPKIDWRITVVGRKVFSTKILENGKGVDGDWRLKKNDVKFVPSDLPEGIQKKCIKILSELGLVFGAFDLVQSGNKFYFLEINPTGEWAWLVTDANLNIHKSICDCLCR